MHPRKKNKIVRYFNGVLFELSVLLTLVLGAFALSIVAGVVLNAITKLFGTN